MALATVLESSAPNLSPILRNLLGTLLFYVDRMPNVTRVNQRWGVWNGMYLAQHF